MINTMMKRRRCCSAWCSPSDSADGAVLQTHKLMRVLGDVLGHRLCNGQGPSICVTSSVFDLLCVFAFRLHVFWFSAYLGHEIYLRPVQTDMINRLVILGVTAATGFRGLQNIVPDSKRLCFGNLNLRPVYSYHDDAPWIRRVPAGRAGCGR